jgi:hypothetical protein
VLVWTAQGSRSGATTCATIAAVFEHGLRDHGRHLKTSMSKSTSISWSNQFVECCGNTNGGVQEDIRLCGCVFYIGRVDMPLSSSAWRASPNGARESRKKERESELPAWLYTADLVKG